MASGQEKHPPHVRAYAVKWMLQNTAETQAVIKQIKVALGATVTKSAVRYWRIQAGIPRYTPPRVEKQKVNGSFIDRQDMEAISRFNSLIKYMKPTEIRA